MSNKYLIDNSHNFYMLFYWPFGCVKLLNLVNIFKSEHLIWLIPSHLNGNPTFQSQDEILESSLTIFLFPTPVIQNISSSAGVTLAETGHL